MNQTFRSDFLTQELPFLNPYRDKFLHVLSIAGHGEV